MVVLFYYIFSLSLNISMSIGSNFEYSSSFCNICLSIYFAISSFLRIASSKGAISYKNLCIGMT